MTAPKFTPGPWRVIEHSWSDVGVYAGDHRVVLLSIRDEATELDQFELQDRDSANAHLIAAAPELYEVLQTVLDCMTQGAIKSPLIVHRDKPSESLYYVIERGLAKARGEQP